MIEDAILMFTLCFVAAIMMAAFIGAITIPQNSRYDGIIALALSAIIMAGFWNFAIHPAFVATETTDVTNTPIYSVNIFSDVNGEFVFGTGSIESTMQYYYYVKRGDGGFDLSHVPYDYTTIYTDENISPYLKSVAIYNAHGVETYRHCELHIPNNSIRKEFEVNP